MLVTGNFDLTVRRVVRVLDGKVDVWLLVADSAGINVWCAAGKGTFGTEELVRRVQTTGLSDVVSHRKLVVPQLGLRPRCEADRRLDLRFRPGARLPIQRAASPR